MKFLFDLVIAFLGFWSVCVMSSGPQTAAVDAGIITGTGTWQSGIPAIFESTSQSQRRTTNWMTGIPANLGTTSSSSSDTTVQTTTITSVTPTETDTSSTDSSITSTTSVSLTRGHGSGFWTGSDPFSFVPPSSWTDTMSTTDSEITSPSSSASTSTSSSRSDSVSTSSSQSQISDQPVSTSTYITYVTAGSVSGVSTIPTSMSTGMATAGSNGLFPHSDGQSIKVGWVQLTVSIMAICLVLERAL